MKLTQPQAGALRALANAITEVVGEAGPLGAPAGVIYAALSAHGFSLAQFQQLMDALVSLGKVRRQGDLYHAV
jgi:hypothetical protein